MAIKNLDADNGVGTDTAGSFGSTGTVGSQQSGSFSSRNGKKSLGFFNGDVKLMSSNKATDYATSITSIIKDAYKGVEDGGKIQVTLLDKDVMTGLEYSYIVVSRKNANINYFVVVLEATGRKPMTASEIINEFNTAIRSKQGSRNLFTTGDAINGVLRGLITEMLAKHYAVNNVPADQSTIIAADGLIVPYSVDDVELVARNVAAIAFNALNVISVLDNPTVSDVNIHEGNAETNNAILNIVSSVNKSTSIDEMGTPIRADWKIEMGVQQQNTQYNNLNYAEELNKGGVNNVLTKTCGFVEAYPEEVRTPLPNGNEIREIRFHPHIIVTDIATAKPTIGFMMLGLLSSLVMTNRDMWLASVMPDGSKYHAGYLNRLSDIEGNGSADVLDFEATSKGGKERKYAPEKVYSIVNEMFRLSPVVSMDIPDYGPHTYYTSVLSAAASGNNKPNTIGAIRTLIETVNVLTNGEFPTNFDINSVFAHEGIMVPLGIWRDKTGTRRDIRDIDLTMICKEENDPEVIKNWITSSAPARITNMDPYLTKVDVISRIIPNAEITGRGVRVTFTSTFIETLVAAAMRAGFAVRYEPEMKLLEQNNLSITSGLLNNAVLNNVSGFARQNVVMGPNFNTSWVNSGYGRFGR